MTQQTTFSPAGSDLVFNRMGYGAMQLAGPHVFGPPKDRAAALAVLRATVELGINHIDTADFYGPYVTNEVIRKALHPYREDLHIVTKVGFLRDAAGGWNPANSPAQLREAVLANLDRLGLEQMDVVNFRAGGAMGPDDSSIAEGVQALASMQREGLLRYIGLSNVTAAQVQEAQGIAQIVCVQNQYNLVHRGDDALIDALQAQGIAYVPFFPLGGFTPLQSSSLIDVAKRLEATPMQVALAWLLQRSANILVIPGTSSVAHLRENAAAAELVLDRQAIEVLNGIAA
ncbi:MAG: oxidoreductase [Massilia sp.]